MTVSLLINCKSIHMYTQLDSSVACALIALVAQLIHHRRQVLINAGFGKTMVTIRAKALKTR